MGDFLPFEKNGDILLDPLGTVLPIILVVFLMIGVSQSRLPRTLKSVLYGALVLRVFGALTRYMILFGVYNGSGDARNYYRGGLQHAAELWRGDLGPLFNPENWWNEQWHGTQFVYFPSSLVAAFTGPSMLGMFIVFSLFALAGLYCFILAFRRAYPDVPVWRYARWVCFFPALWYWPSSIGKEAIVLLGMGLCMVGYVGKGSRISWLPLAAGVFLVYGIRPQVAAVVLFSIMVGHWLSLVSGRWTIRRTVQAAVLVTIGLAGISMAMGTQGVEELSVEGVTSYIEGEGGREVGGDSSLEAIPIGITGVPLALINILLRPFLWEAHNFMVLITCFEIMGFWGIVWIRRRTFVAAMRQWRHDRLLRVAIPFILLYSVSLGMVIANMGIIARQRIFLFPFLFLLVEAVPRRAGPRSRGSGTSSRLPRRRWVHPRRLAAENAR